MMAIVYMKCTTTVQSYVTIRFGLDNIKAVGCLSYDLLLKKYRHIHAIHFCELRLRDHYSIYTGEKKIGH